MTGIALGPVITINGRNYIRRSDLDRYKDEVYCGALRIAPGKREPINPDPLIPLKQVAVELGVGRRTIGRRVKTTAACALAPAASPKP